MTLLLTADHPFRPDWGVAEVALGRLWEKAYLTLRRVSCECADGVLTLHGRVPSYYLKQLAQEAVAEVPGVREIVNAIEVVPELRFQGARTASVV